jgi:hypothetical protein
MIEQRHPEYEEVERQIDDVERQLTVIHLSVDDYREYVDKTAMYYKLIDEVRSNMNRCQETRRISIDLYSM